MRIISGAHKGRRLETPAWAGLRPTSDRLRETVFNILAPRMDDARVLDGCAGTGAVGIEALSRGAAHVTFVEADRRAIELIARNLARCRIEGGHAIIRADLRSPGARLLPSAFDVIFLDPPYDMDPSEMMAAAAGSLRIDGVLVLEHARRRQAAEQAGPLRLVRRVVSGDSALAFYAHEHAEVEGSEPR